MKTSITIPALNNAAQIPGPFRILNRKTGEMSEEYPDYVTASLMLGRRYLKDKRVPPTKHPFADAFISKTTKINWDEWFY